MKKIKTLMLLASTIALSQPATAQFEASTLVGTWHCSFESNSPSQSLVGTSVDTYFADGRSISESNLSLQLHEIGLDIAYELTIEGKWQLIGDTIEESVTAVPQFISSNPTLEQMISLKQELLNGETESAKVIELSAQTAIFQTTDEQSPPQEIRCTR